MKRSLISGITGQDGAYLAEFLLKRDYEVHGIKRRSSSFNTDRIDHLYEDPHVEDRRLILHYGDLTDSTSVIRTVQEVEPDEIYNLGAMSHVAVSFATPEYTANADGLGVLLAQASTSWAATGRPGNALSRSIQDISGRLRSKRCSAIHRRQPGNSVGNRRSVSKNWFRK